MLCSSDVTTTKPGTVEWVHCYYDALNRRDWEWISAMLAPDVEWFHAARDERLRGMHSVMNAFRGLFDPAPTARVEVRNVHTAGPVLTIEAAIRHAASEGDRKSSPPSRSVTPGRASRIVAPPSFCEVMQLEGGRCVRGATYADSVRLLMDISSGVAAA